MENITKQINAAQGCYKTILVLLCNRIARETATELDYFVFGVLHNEK